jgi:hypothetical protein
MKDYPRKALMITWLTYFAVAIYQLFSNDALVFPSPINAIVVLGISIYSTLSEYRTALKSERTGILLFSFSSIVMFLSDSFMMSIFLEHEIVSDWLTSPYLLLTQELALLALLTSLLVIAYHVSKIKKIFGLLYLVLFSALVILGFFDVNLEALVVLILVGLMSLTLALVYRHQLTSATNALLYLWVIQVSINCFEYWNLNL